MSWADDLPDKYVECRSLGHAWTSEGSVRYGRGKVSVVTCPRCSTRRRQFVVKGRSEKASYDYPDDYCKPPEAESVPRRDFTALRLRNDKALEELLSAAARAWAAGK